MWLIFYSFLRQIHTFPQADKTLTQIAQWVNNISNISKE